MMEKMLKAQISESSNSGEASSWADAVSKSKSLIIICVNKPGVTSDYSEIVIPKVALSASNTGFIGGSYYDSTHYKFVSALATLTSCSIEYRVNGVDQSTGANVKYYYV